MNNIRKYWRSSSILAVVVVTILVGWLFYWLNYYTPIYADDYSYSFSFMTGERITSVAQIVGSQQAHYQYINGRCVTHSLAQLFLLVGDRVFNAANTFFFLIFLFLIYFHAFGFRKKLSAARLALLAILLFLSCPAFGQSFLWMTGSANYLYGILIVLLVLLPFRLQMERRRHTRYSLVWEFTAAVLYFPLGILAGWTNENTAVAMIVVIILYIMLFHFTKVKIHIWNISGCLGAIIGCGIMLSAPGTANRLSAAGGSGGLIDWGKRLIFYTCDMVSYLHLIWLLLICLSCIFLFQRRHLIRELSLRNIALTFSGCGVTLIYFMGFLASVYSMIVSPQFPGRAWSGPTALILIAVGNLVSLVENLEREQFDSALISLRIKMGKRLTLVFLTILCIAAYIPAFYELKRLNAAHQEREIAIETAISAGESYVEIPDICGESGYSCYDDSGALSADSSQWPNTAIAKYYGIGEIVLGNSCSK